MIVLASGWQLKIDVDIFNLFAVIYARDGLITDTFSPLSAVDHEGRELGSDSLDTFSSLSSVDHEGREQLGRDSPSAGTVCLIWSAGDARAEGINAPCVVEAAALLEQCPGWDDCSSVPPTFPVVTASSVPAPRMRNINGNRHNFENQPGWNSH